MTSDLGPQRTVLRRHRVRVLQRRSVRWHRPRQLPRSRVRRARGWAQKIVERVDGGYVEASPSGTGIHIITRGSVRDGGMRKGPKVEMYSRGRFFTITGRAL